MDNLKPLSSVAQFSPDDLPELQKYAKQAFDHFILEFPPIHPLGGDEWPIRWMTYFHGEELEVVVSEMGSITIRLSKSERYRRNPPPLFYSSLGKSTSGSWEWQTPEREVFDLFRAPTKAYLEEKITLLRS